MHATIDSIKIDMLPNIIKYAPLIKDEASWLYYRMFVEQPFKQHSYEEIKPFLNRLLDNNKQTKQE